MCTERNPWIYCCMLYLMRLLQSRPLYSCFTRRQSAINMIRLQLNTYATGKFQIKYRNQLPASYSTKTRNILLKLQAAVTSHLRDWHATSHCITHTPSLPGEHVQCIRIQTTHWHVVFTLTTKDTYNVSISTTNIKLDYPNCA